MENSTYIHSSHNVSLLLFHFVTPRLRPTDTPGFYPGKVHLALIIGRGYSRLFSSSFCSIGIVVYVAILLSW